MEREAGEAGIGGFSVLQRRYPYPIAEAASRPLSALRCRENEVRPSGRYQELLAQQACLYLDNAILAAAKQAQEDARRAREIADAEREKAIEVAKAAQARAEELDRQAQLAAQLADAAHQDELERAKARADEAVRNEARRADEALEAERRRHREELAERDARVLEREREAQRARRRLLFGAALVIAVVVFFLLDLVVGLESAWSVVVAASVIIGLGIGISQWTRWRTGSS